MDDTGRAGKKRRTFDDASTPNMYHSKGLIHAFQDHASNEETSSLRGPAASTGSCLQNAAQPVASVHVVSQEQCTYLYMAYEKAMDIVRHVERVGCQELHLKIRAEEMGETLQELGGPEPLEERLSKLEQQSFVEQQELVVAATCEVASSDTSNIRDPRLKVLVSSLKSRLSRLVTPPE